MKFVDNVNLSVPVRENQHPTPEVVNIIIWSTEIRMKLNFTETWGKEARDLLLLITAYLSGIEHKDSFVLLGIFNNIPFNWDLQIDSILRKTNSRFYILGVCRYRSIALTSYCNPQLSLSA